MNELLELETRRKIYDLVSRNPGLHLSKIAEMLSMRVSLAEYHLLYLEKNNVIRVAKEAGYTRYYVEGAIGTLDKRILSVLMTVYGDFGVVLCCCCWYCSCPLDIVGLFFRVHVEH